jgi:hypothetical protein
MCTTLTLMLISAAFYCCFTTHEKKQVYHSTFYCCFYLTTPLMEKKQVHHSIFNCCFYLTTPLMKKKASLSFHRVVHAAQPMRWPWNQANQLTLRLPTPLPLSLVATERIGTSASTNAAATFSAGAAVVGP